MRKYMLLLVVIVLCSACIPATNSGTPIPPASSSVPVTIPKIDRHPYPVDWHRAKLTSIPTYDPNSDEMWQMDLRSNDLSSLDLSKSLDDLYYADFDSKTVWPPDDKLPKEFDWKCIMELGRNPGLGIRGLHARGITGRGVSIAIIDQPLLVDHQEYADRLRLYEEINVKPNTESQMHGPAVASIAVGKTVGVAPGANLYYIGAWTGDWGVGEGGFTYNFRYYAQGIRRILEINQQLPKDQKIRVISMQIGWRPEQAGYDDITAAAKEAIAAGMLVVSSSIEQVHGFKFHGLGRAPLADPDVFESYEPGIFWAREFYTGGQSVRNFYAGRLLIPMDSRTTADPTDVNGYAFYREGGWSWSIPYIAGMYALAAQVDPKITPDKFWSLALKTGRTIDLKHEGQTIPFGPILDPAAHINALQKGNG
jgi:hypothetical protein